MPSPSSPPAGTALSVAANVAFSGQQITINSGDITKGISNLVFSLSNPVVLGSIDNFIDGLNTEFGVPLTSADITNAINSIPATPAVLGRIRDALIAITTTDLIITILNINVAAGFFQIGVSFPVSIPITSFLSFEGIGILVTKGGSTGSPSSP
ncbi:MAG TPA: hypothetical protein VE974_14325 [Thermoanaerobaculia bacterium]|nr:hypothetical protein [Thermoanaerobaculia bacterium]